MLSLNLRDSRPIYEQVRDGLRRLIITGAIPCLLYTSDAADDANWL